MEAELQTYKDQLAYVNLSLEADASNDDLLKLKTELLEVISLTQSAIDSTAGASKDVAKGKAKAKDTNWQDKGPFRAGMDCSAKYKDGKWWVSSSGLVDS
jgi:survival-of-motor-neuron-related-splicing factor 30